MRVSAVLLLALMACVAFAQFDGALNLPPPPSFEADQASLVEAGAEAADWSGSPELENWEGRSRNSALSEVAAKAGGKKQQVNVNKGDLSAFDSLDWKKIPTDKQLPGDVVRLRHAPGAVPPLNEEVLPQSLLPPPGCKDANSLNDVKLWNQLTTKIKQAKVTGVKYAKWLKAADVAFKKVKAQIKLTKKNHGLIKKAVAGMIHQRRQIVKRLKASKLKIDLVAAEAKMKKLNAYGKVLGRTKSSLVEGKSSMTRRVKQLKGGIKSLQTFGNDA
jgi:hypothetical protein